MIFGASLGQQPAGSPSIPVRAMMTLNHGFSGYVCGRALMPLIARRSPVGEGWLALAFFLGAMAPDLDGLSNFIARGTYFSYTWFGHRQATHSIAGTLVLALIGASLLVWPAARRGRIPWRRGFPWLAGCFWAGGLLHIVGDLMTPRMAMPVFWPWAERFGSFSHIGWFSPYLFWMFVIAIGLERSARLGMGLVGPLRPWRGTVVWAISTLAAARWVEYLVTSRFESASQWAAYQSSLLPDAMIGPLSAGVRTAWFWMVR